MDATGQPLSVWAAEDGICVTSVFDIRLGGDAPPLRQAKANARLISAAPDLLAALEGVVSAYGDTTWGTVYAMERALPAARAAIAKAKGGSS